MIKPLPITYGAEHTNTRINKHFFVGMVVEITRFNIIKDNRNYPVTGKEIHEYFKQIPND